MTRIATKPKAIILFSLICATVSCQSVSQKKSNEKSSNKDFSKEIVANYEGGQVTVKDAAIELEKLIAKNEKLKGLTFDKLSTDQKEAIVKEVVLREAAYKEAHKRKLEKDEDYQASLKIFESEFLKQKLFVRLIEDAKEEKNLKKNYSELVEKLKNKKDLRVSYIAVKTQGEAEVIYQSLLKYPASFSAQARKKSLDKEIGKKGGDLGFVLEDALPAELLKQIKILAKGEISKPIQVSDKWVIVKFEEERPAEILPYEKIKDALAQNLAKKAVEDFVSQSLEKAKISILVK